MIIVNLIFLNIFKQTAKVCELFHVEIIVKFSTKKNLLNI